MLIVQKLRHPNKQSRSAIESSFAHQRRGRERRNDMDRRCPLRARDFTTGRQNNAAYKHPKYSDHQYHHGQQPCDCVRRRVAWLFCLSSRTLGRTAIREACGETPMAVSQDQTCDVFRPSKFMAAAMARFVDIAPFDFGTIPRIRV